MSSSSSAFLNQFAVVTGASGAVGSAIADALIAGGATVCVAASTQQSVDDLIRQCAWPSDRAIGCAVDLAVETDVERFCIECCERYPQVDVLVHCAGTITLDPVQRGRLEDFDRQYRINLRAPYQITQALLPRLISAGGQVVFINSTAGLRGVRQIAQYAATKHGLRALADSLRDEVNESGVRVLSVFLGRTASRMQSDVHRLEGRPYDTTKLLQPEDVASMVIHALELPRTAEVTDLNIRPFLKSY